MAVLRLPVTDDFWHQFEIDLDGNTYQLSFKWNFTDSAWYMDLVGLTNTVDFKGIKVTSGVDLLVPFAITELGQMFAVDLENQSLDPNQSDFGDRYQLLYIEKVSVGSV
jgi:hypothetical protein